ncbi:MAG TPA: MFS transporter [Longimicrobiales bacterium]
MTAGRIRKIREYGITAGTLGSTAGQTVMVALLPVLLAEYAPSAVWIGFAIGGEGLFALLVPYWIGALSDHLPHRLARRWGRRTLFLVLTAPVMAAAMTVAPFVSGYWPLAGLAFLYFAAFHGYLTPLWALMVDAVPEDRLGRVHGVRGALHAAGLAYGLVAGGLLFALWPPLPFLVGAALVLATTAMTMWAAPRPHAPGGESADAPPTGEARAVWRELATRPDVRGFLVANALWTGAVDGIRPYIFLFAVAVLGIDTAETSAVLLLLVGGIGIGSVLLGRLGDIYGRVPVLGAGALLTAVAMLLGVMVRELDGAVLLLLASGLGAAALIALPYPLFAALVGGAAIGRYTGLYILSLGLARVAAPVMVGIAIDLGRPLFPEFDGYPLMWPVAGLMALVGAAVLRRSLAGTRAE